jgi:transcriptional regulator with XRE-family HTH domain
MNNNFVSERPERIMYGMRIQTNCSQAEWGRKFGLTQPTVSAIESGKRQVTDELVDKVDTWFNIDRRCILGQVPMNWASL